MIIYELMIFIFHFPNRKCQDYACVNVDQSTIVKNKALFDTWL